VCEREIVRERERERERDRERERERECDEVGNNTLSCTISDLPRPLLDCLVSAQTVDWFRPTVVIALQVIYNQHGCSIKFSEDQHCTREKPK
jgi:hypothetical protein